jgi:hypothetical protein
MVATIAGALPGDKGPVVVIEVRTEQAAPRRLAAVPSVTTPQDQRRNIGRSLGIIWLAVREQGARFGHNVFVYRDGEPETMIVEVGVEVLGDFTVRGEIRIVQTPSGEVATAAYYGHDWHTSANSAIAVWERPRPNDRICLIGYRSGAIGDSTRPAAAEGFG